MKIGGCVEWFASAALAAAPDTEITIDELAATNLELRSVMLTYQDREKCKELLRFADDTLVIVLFFIFRCLGIDCVRATSDVG